MTFAAPLPLPRRIVSLSVALALVLAAAPWRQTVARDLGEAISVIVTKIDPADPGPEDAVDDLGGEVTQELPIVDGFAARVPASSINDLRTTPGVATVSPDRTVHVQSGGSGGGVLNSVYPKVVRANKMWDAGYTGQGVTVALVDTGVADVPDLAGRVLPVYDDVLGTTSPCLNLTGEPDCSDSYGHGTFLAGIIAGNGAASGGAWKGVAPDANLVSIKVAGRDGSSDVSTVLAAIQWAVSFKDTYGIRVLNLSLGTDGTGSYRTDPFNYAVERAWEAGLAVVVAASNRGPDPGTISKPGDDPWVITVGATDDRGTPGIGDDTLPDFSARGMTAADGLAKPDLTAPGAHMVSLRAPGSAIDTAFPNYVDGSYRRGSGTSMSTAVVSGAIALMVDADPTLAPDRVKYALAATARNAASTDPNAVGSGVPDVYNATFTAPPGLANLGLDRSTGMGSLDASRGTVRVQADDPLLTIVEAGLTLQLMAWDPISYTTGEWSGSKWYASKWYGSKWYASKWYGSKWYGSKWYGSKWYGQDQPPESYGQPLDGGAWLGAYE